MAPPSKQEMRRHFDESPALVALLRARGKDEPVGLGRAVALAESALDADEGYFASCFLMMLLSRPSP